MWFRHADSLRTQCRKESPRRSDSSCAESLIEDLEKRQPRLPADQLLASPFDAVEGREGQTGTPVTHVPSAAVGAVSQPAVRSDPDLLVTGILSALGNFYFVRVIPAHD